MAKRILKTMLAIGITAGLAILLLWYLGVFSPSQSLPGGQKQLKEQMEDFQLKVEAITTLNPALCSEISDKDLKDSCYQELAKGKEDITICNNIKEDSIQKTCVQKTEEYMAQKKDYDNLEQARINFDSTWCSEISNSELQSECEAIVEHRIYLREKYGDNLPACELESHPQLRNDCYRNRAVNEKDPSLCLDALPGKTRDQCYSTVGRVLDDYSICREANKGVESDHCLYRIALEKNELTQELCDELENYNLNPYKDRCLSAISS